MRARRRLVSRVGAGVIEWVNIWRLPSRTAGVCR